MEPRFVDGDLVLLGPLTSRSPLTVGDVVVARHPFKSLDVIKSVAAIDEDGYVQLTSPAGDDSRQFGRAPQTTIRGRVTLNLSLGKRELISND